MYTDRYFSDLWNEYKQLMFQSVFVLTQNLAIKVMLQLPWLSVGGANSGVSNRSSGVVRIELRHCSIKLVVFWRLNVFGESCPHLLATCLGSRHYLHYRIQLSCQCFCCQLKRIGTWWQWRRLDAEAKEACSSWDGRWKPVSIVATLRLSKSIPA